MGVMVANTSMTEIALRGRAVEAQQGLSREEKLDVPRMKGHLYIRHFSYPLCVV